MTSVSTSPDTSDTDDGRDRDEAATVSLYRNVRAVTPDAVLDDAHVVVEDGVITSVGTGVAPAANGRAQRTIDGRGLLLLPGLIDTHSDGYEKEISPRRTAQFDLGFAIESFEGRLRSAGVVTVCHGVGYQEKEGTDRSVERAKALYDAIETRRAEPAVGVDHRILYRTEARDLDALDHLLADIDEGRTGGAERVLVSFEDHTPGQGQYRDVTQFEAAVDPASVPEGMTVKEHVQGIIDRNEALIAVRDANRSKLTARAEVGDIILLAHDVDTAEDVTMALEMGASVAEFPVSFDAASAARDADMTIVMGAPNALRGRSHSANASARDLIAEGLCDVLASDYLPSTMLGAVSQLATEGVCDLAAAVRLVTSGPAAMLGLDDRGRIAEGARADVILVDDRGSWPSVVGVYRVDDDPARRLTA
ncbi:MAG: alpha-D-ribose 1-methylphosphonate 5-triphosphate diphosphatase [Actinomycetota bacterium]